MSRRVPGGESSAGEYYISRPRINLDFSDLSYPAYLHNNKGKKPIIQGVSGSFKSGEITAILGSSGAGKSTLLNILTGCISTDVGGSIKINGCPCHPKILQKLSSYIMQEDLIQNYLTVEESMKIAVELKVTKELPEKEKSQIIKQILQTLGLEDQRSTRTERLSGGQKKRLSIALELVNNPSFVYLDEPTTGLDVVSTTQVIKLLHKLARQGHTVICTIHQPSAFLCQFFDHMYVMSRGCCVYQGSYQKLVPFLSSISYDCPTTYNPADYVVEIIQGNNWRETQSISQIIENGKLSIEASESGSDEGFVKVNRQQEHSTKLPCDKRDLLLATGFGQQFRVLLSRKMKQQIRNWMALTILLSHHVFTGMMLGMIFRGVGEDVSRPFENFKFIVSVVVFFLYTNIMGPVLLFPMEMKHMKREYINGWYNLKAYFAALTVANLPYQILFGIFFMLISYTISSQPMDTRRIFFFIIIGLLLGVASEGWGLTIGSLFNSQNGSIVGPATIVPLLAVALYGMGFGKAVEPFMGFLMNLSYLRHGLVGLINVIYGYNRTLVCDFEKNIYCHYRDPSLLIKDLGMEGSSFNQEVVILIIFLLSYRMTAYLAIKYRLSGGVSVQLRNVLQKIFRLRQKRS